MIQTDFSPANHTTSNVKVTSFSKQVYFSAEYLFLKPGVLSSIIGRDQSNGSLSPI